MSADATALTSSSPAQQQLGPYMLHELVDDLPLDTQEHQDVKITCLEAWSQNLYIGTSAHEILHLVSIPSTPNPTNSGSEKPTFILASRLPAPVAANAPPDSYIKQIVVLPTVSRALVLSSSGLLSFYTLPEFSPAFGGTKLKDVAFVGGLDLDAQVEEEGMLEGGGEVQKILVMVLAKSRIRMIKVGDEARLTKDIPVPGVLKTMRKGSIACVATKTEYSLLDVGNLQHMPLFPISSVPDEPPEPAPSPPAQPLAHPPRNSSLTTRERRASSAAATRDLVPSGHSRSVSAGNIGRGPASEPGRGSPARRGSRGGTARPASRTQMHLSPADAEIPRAASASPSRASSGRSSPANSTTQSTPRRPSSTTGIPRPAALTATSSLPPPPPPPPPKDDPSEPAETKPKVEPGDLKPLIAYPAPGEFLLTTGTRPEEPGVGMFVNMEGDVTRGTIQFTRYPSGLLAQDGWAIATVPGLGVELLRCDDQGSEQERRSIIFTERDVQLKQVLSSTSTLVPEIGAALRFVHLHLKPPSSDDPSPTTTTATDADAKRNDEEVQIARRISSISSNVILYSSHQVWTLLPTPLVLRLDARLPSFAAKNFDGIVARVRNVLAVLDEVSRIEPTTEQMFHEVSYIRQKCGLLVLGELLRITARQTSDISAVDIIRTETALLDSSLDPRFIVALFGDTFTSDTFSNTTGSSGVWVYGGIKNLYEDLKNSEEVGKTFTRDVLLLLKRFLASWREKRGFGSVGDDKAVFATVDSALLRVMLLLDSPAYMGEKGKTVVSEGDIRLELQQLIESGVEDTDRAVELLEEFGRLYLLSIFYSSQKRFGDVLGAWKRILETGDPNCEFEGGEERMKAYLLRLKDPKLVEEFGGWLCRRNPKLGIQVFADDKARVKFEPEKVMGILKERAPESVQMYVEYLVVEKKNTKYSTPLLHLYLSSLLDTLSSDPGAHDRLSLSYTTYRTLTPPKPTYRDFILANSLPEDGTTWWGTRLRLLDLLSSTTELSPEELEKLKSLIAPHEDVLIPELIILHSRSGQHKTALSLLVHNLHDFDTAVNYCLFGGRGIFGADQHHPLVLTNKSEQKSLFCLLLNQYLLLEDIGERVSRTGGLLERWGAWLEVEEVMRVIPGDWSLSILGGFLTGELRRLVREKGEKAVWKGLERGKSVKVQARWVEVVEELGPTIEE